MSAPYKHKLGELGEEHFDGDPIHRDLNQSQQMQREQLIGEVLAGMPKNAVQKPVTKKATGKDKR